MRPIRVELPTPFAVGPVNAYVYPEDPVTIVDPGPLYPPAQDAFAEGLRQAGVRLGDIKHIVVTHHHPDHAGYAPLLAQTSGADLLMHPEAAERAAFPYRDENASETLLRRHGVPEAILDAMRRELVRIVGFMAPLRTFRPLQEGEVVTAGSNSLKALVLPGHAPGHLCLQGQDHVAGGDLLIWGITPNPIFEVGSDGRRPSLREYRESLHRVRGLPVVTWLPGHRNDVADPIALINRYEGQMAERQDKLWSLLATGPKTAFALSQELFPVDSGADPFLAVSETLAQLDGLLQAGRVRTRTGDALISFEAM